MPKVPGLLLATIAARHVAASGSVFPPQPTFPMSPFPNELASYTPNETPFQPFELFAGESDIVTSQGSAGTAAVRQFSVVMRAAGGTGAIQEWDGADSAAIIGIAAQAAVPSGPLPYYVGGFFNHEALIWPAGTNTVTLRKAAFDHAVIKIGSLV